MVVLLSKNEIKCFLMATSDLNLFLSIFCKERNKWQSAQYQESMQDEVEVLSPIQTTIFDVMFEICGFALFRAKREFFSNWSNLAVFLKLLHANCQVANSTCQH